MRRRSVLLAFFLLPTLAFAQTTQPLDVRVTVDAGKTVGPMTPLYRFFGADEPNYAYMKDGRRLLGEIGKLGKPPAYFRAHNLLSSGDLTPSLKWGSTNVYAEDAAGKPVYDFTTVDRIIDAYKENGVRPYVELGFMPEALSTHPEPYRHEWRPGLPYERIMTGWSYPPKSYDAWRDLCRKLTEHCVEKYGKSEVESWYFECWNEANGLYWHGSAEEFYKLHDYAIDGVRQALPTARVGGPHSAGAGGEFTRKFLDHCLHGTNYATGKTGTPLDFVSFHAKGAPTFVDGHVRCGIGAQLKEIDKGLAIVGEFPGLKNTPVILGESDPDGCAACQGPQLGYRNTTMYSSYTAASFAREYLINDARGTNLQGAVTWAFEFEDQPYFAGQRVMASNGVVLPVFNVFRMLAKMTGDRVATSSTGQVPLDEVIRSGVRGRADVGATAARDGDAVTVLLWHYHDDDVPGPDASVTVDLTNLPAKAYTATEFRVDGSYSNAYAAWKAAGGPVAPDEKLYAAMRKASDLATTGPATNVAANDGHARLTLTLPRQGVSLVTLVP